MRKKYWKLFSIPLIVPDQEKIKEQHGNDKLFQEWLKIVHMLIENQGHNFRLKKIHYLLFFNWDWHTAGKAEIHMHRERKDVFYRV